MAKMPKSNRMSAVLILILMQCLFRAIPAYPNTRPQAMKKSPTECVAPSPEFAIGGMATYDFAVGPEN